MTKASATSVVPAIRSFGISALPAIASLEICEVYLAELLQNGETILVSKIEEFVREDRARDDSG